MPVNAEAVSKCSCQHCGNHIEFPVSGAGADVDCPHCGARTRLVLEPSNSRAKPPGASSNLSYAFNGRISKPSVSILYRLGLLLVSLLIVLLPLVYAGMVAALAYGLWRFGYGLAPSVVRSLRYSLHAQNPIWLILTLPGFRQRHHPNGLGSLLLYVLVLFLGSLLLVFMAKPLFSRRPRRAQAMAVTPELQPELFAFVKKLCGALGVPMPQRIEVDCHPNAGVELREKARGLFGNDLVLRIGLSLVAALELRQFAGVLAHELGHFSQGFGLRSAYVIRGINEWFARIVYGRDAWDEWLEYQRDLGGIFSYGAAGVLYVLQLSRWVLQMVMLIARGLSSFLLRQMEFHADSYEIQIAGTAGFESTTRQLALLREAFRRAEKEAQATWNLGRHLPDNFPKYVLSKAGAAQVRVDPVSAKPSLFDTHPSDAERIRRAREAATLGVFQADLPATALFCHFEVLARQATFAHYSQELGLVLEDANLRPVTA